MAFEVITETGEVYYELENSQELLELLILFLSELE
jgi:hypothetical protein